jgi:hypothetical protein
MIPAWALFQACLLPTTGGGRQDKGGDGPEVYLERGETRRTTDRDGRLSVEFDVPSDAASFQITGSAGELVSFDQLIDPDGEVVLDWQDWLDGSESLTLAFLPQRTTTALSWPVREQDGPLEAGRWTAWLSIYDEDTYQPVDHEVEVDLYSDITIDPDLGEGRVSVQIVWARGVEDEPGVEDAIEQAIDRWTEIWGDRDLKLDIEHLHSDLDPDLDFFYTGADEIEDFARDGEEGGLQLVIGETVEGDDSLLGVSAGIPGTVEPSPHSFVVLSWLTHAGRDGEFDEEEIRIMGETMAHELGHYVGLFHPVEGDLQGWDALDDTEHCTSTSSCERELGENLMYPYPLCDSDGCGAQGELTSEQESVMQQYVGAL